VLLLPVPVDSFNKKKLEGKLTLPMAPSWLTRVGVVVRGGVTTLIIIVGLAAAAAALTWRTGAMEVVVPTVAALQGRTTGGTTIVEIIGFVAVLVVLLGVGELGGLLN